MHRHQPHQYSPPSISSWLGAHIVADLKPNIYVFLFWSSTVNRSNTRQSSSVNVVFFTYTRDLFYVRRKVDLMKTTKVNAYIMHIFGKIEILSIDAT